MTDRDGRAERPLLLDVNQVAGLLGCGRTTVYHLIWDHELPVVKIGRLTRIPTEAVERYIDRELERAA